MDVLTKLFVVYACFSLSGCYYLKSAYHQMDLLYQRVPIEKALQDPKLSEAHKSKLRLTMDVRIFAEQNLGLNTGGNYSSFVQLDQPYVTYVVSAAPKWELKHHLWSFPIIGKAPYKGYFLESDAKVEEQGLKDQNLDTYLRGVAAYSTLGWFRDPLLSSMLRYQDADLVNTLIHETVHATMYIKSNADFNERMAVFIGNWGTELYYKSKEGPDSKTVQKIRDENQDERIFAEFITKELDLLGKWYQKVTDKEEPHRQKRFREIQERFATEVKPRLKAKSYDQFTKLELNNARLLIYKTYLQDLSLFEKLADRLGWDFKMFLERIKTLEKHPEPEQGLRELVEQG